MIQRRQPPAIVPRPHGFSRFGRRLRHTLAVLALLVLVGGLLSFLWVRRQLQGSLPQLAGEIRLPGLRDEVRIERDDLGIPTIRAHHRTDLAFATGFVHGQDRFFQMDLQRRHAAGELAELLGGALVAEDRRVRIHRFREVARRVLEKVNAADRAILSAYVRGVEAGRHSLRTAPFEYLALGVEPAPWTEEDIVLVIQGMFLSLQERAERRESARGLLHDVLPPALVEFLSPPGTRWDAALDDSTFTDPPIPGPDVLDLRKRTPHGQPRSSGERLSRGEPDEFVYGSNNWAVAGRHTVHGGAIVANDMHLWLSVPGVWYRAELVWPADGAARPENRLIGVTLPGTPALVVGSNTHIAWGFTNTEGDWADLVVLELDPKDSQRYRTPAGWRTLTKRREIIKVKGAADVVAEIEETIWGPVVDRDHRGRKRVLHWVAHDPTALNFDLMGLEEARTVEEAVRVAQRTGLPEQNFVVADERGDIAWTVLGRIPRRIGYDGQRPVSWADGRCRWDGWLDPGKVPCLVRPAEGRLWTANNRVIGGAALKRIGQGNYDLGARAQQIRDQLRVERKFHEADMLAIQLDDRALFLERWRKLLLEVLTPEATAGNLYRQAVRRQVAFWGGRAVPESVGYRLVRHFRQTVHQRVLEALTVPCRQADPAFEIRHLASTVEESVWRLATQKPDHLLPPGQTSWQALALEAVDSLRGDLPGQGDAVAAGLTALTWGAANDVRVRHPFSRQSPLLAWWLDLDMTPQALPGDSAHMPRILGVHGGASERLAVSPGREAEGYFHMPAGQSGHPLSPHYRDGHAAWAEGKATPFLPGPARNVLILRPGE